MSPFVPRDSGLTFRAGDDTARMIVSGDDSGGAYSLLEWTVAVAPPEEASAEAPDYGPHLHRLCEETFLIQQGTLEFLLGDEIRTLAAGDFVRVPQGTRHGYRNTSGAPVSMLVTFVPAGIEELFVKYRTDRPAPEGAGFVADATRFHASVFGLPNP